MESQQRSGLFIYRFKDTPHILRDASLNEELAMAIYPKLVHAHQCVFATPLAHNIERVDKEVICSFIAAWGYHTYQGKSNASLDKGLTSGANWQLLHQFSSWPFFKSSLQEILYFRVGSIDSWTCIGIVGSGYWDTGRIHTCATKQAKQNPQKLQNFTP